MTTAASSDTITLAPASDFTVQQLTDAYNQTRVDYLVPMPMNARRLQEYIDVYDINMQHSAVALDTETGDMLGLSMLGLRRNPDRAWVTRLGVIPNRRRRGTGQALMDFMLAAAESCVELTMLEVIKGNEPAHALFLKCGFQATRELLVIRRAPGPVPHTATSAATWLDRDAALALLPTRADVQAWTNEGESLHHAADVRGLQVTLPDGMAGWVVFQPSRLQLSRLTFATTAGRPVPVARELLAHLHTLYPLLDTYTENIPTYDPHLPAFIQFGYFEVFRRIEMYRYTDGWLPQHNGTHG